MDLFFSKLVLDQSCRDRALDDGHRRLDGGPRVLRRREHLQVFQLILKTWVSYSTKLSSHQLCFYVPTCIGSPMYTRAPVYVYLCMCTMYAYLYMCSYVCVPLHVGILVKQS